MGDLISAESLPFALSVIGVAFFVAPIFEGEIPFFGKIDWTASKKKSSRTVGAACLLIAAVLGGFALLDEDDSTTDTTPTTTEASTTSTTQPKPTTTTTSEAPRPAPSLQLVEVSLSNDSPEVAGLDIIVTNDGDQVSVITGAELDVTYLGGIIASGLLPASGVYQVELPRDVGEDPLVLPHELRQTVDPVGGEAVDRFEIVLAVEPGGPAAYYDFEVAVTLLHDGDLRTTWPESFFVRLLYRE